MAPHSSVMQKERKASNQIGAEHIMQKIAYSWGKYGVLCGPDFKIIVPVSNQFLSCLNWQKAKTETSSSYTMLHSDTSLKHRASFGQSRPSMQHKHPMRALSSLTKSPATSSYRPFFSKNLDPKGLLRRLARNAHPSFTFLIGLEAVSKWYCAECTKISTFKQNAGSHKSITLR